MKKTCNAMKKILASVIIAVMILTSAPVALAETFSAIVTSSTMAVYKNSSLSKKLGTLKKGTVVLVTDHSGSVAKIKYNGKTGYAKVAAMDSVEDVAEKAIVNTKTKIFKTAKVTSKNTAVKKGTELYVLATSGKWARVERDGKVGYMNLNHLTIVDDFDEPLPTATPKPTAKPTEKPTPTPDITVSVFEARVTKDVKVYKSASTSSTYLGTLKKGDIVTVGAYSDNGWAYVRRNGKYGYCKYDCLVRIEEEAATPTPKPTATPTVKPTAEPNLDDAVEATVTASKLAVYKKASTASKKLGHIYKGEEVNVIKWNSTWAYIEMDGKYGYCKVKGLTKTSELDKVTPTPKPTATPTVKPTATPDLDDAVEATVTSKTLAVYKKASTASKKLGTLKKGEEVNVIRWNSTWAYIELDGKYGYCKVKGLTKTSELENTPKPTATPNLDDAIKATVTADSVNVYKTASTSSTKLGTLKKGQEVNVISKNDTWAYIERNGSYGFCKLSALTKTSELEKEEENKLPDGYAEGGFTATVVKPGAKVYVTASTDAKSASLVLGQSVKVYAYSDDWACIVQGKEYGFVPTKHLSKTSYETVKESGDALQTILKALLTYGYYDGIPSTTYNTAATTAIKRFQKDCGLTQTGQADQALQRILFSGYAPTSSVLSKELSRGDKGTSVTRIQTRLYNLGYLSKTTSVDGDYGSTTVNAVKLFQNANGMTPSGTASIATLKDLYSTGAIKKPSNVKAADTSSSSGGSTSGTSWSLEMPSSLASFTTSKGDTLESKIEYLIYVGQNQLGKPYIYGTEGPNSYDCSGFTMYCYKKLGITLKRSAYSQGYDTTYTKITSPSSLKRGDLVFFNTVSDSDLSDHAGIYLGKGYFIHASSGGAKVVVSNLNTGYYSRVFSWAHRPLQ